MPEFTITLELPPVFAHNSGGWRAKSPKVKALRKGAWAEAVRLGAPKIGRGSIQYRFFFPDDRVRDEANYIHACKPQVDGLVDAGVIDDDRWQYLKTSGVTSSIDRKNPRVELVISTDK